MASQPQEEENLLLDLFDYPKEQSLLIDFEKIAVPPVLRNQPPKGVYLTTTKTDIAISPSSNEFTPPPAKQSLSPPQVSSDGISNNAGSSSSASAPVETSSSITTADSVNINFWDLHPGLRGLAEREAKYLALNQQALGGPGELTPKFVTDLANHKEGTLCYHNEAWVKLDENWQKCAKCKGAQPCYIFECQVCKTLLCRRCRQDVLPKRGHWTERLET
ncbi:hypothetical protein TWF281_001147 [Arthrobotrys megalospora]